jgi:DNA-binding IclR family transcriptional regulator
VARRSPQTERLVEMIETLAALPQRDYRLAELARLVELDAATCHPMLTELTRVGWLVKDRGKKTYRLGPRLIAVGAAAQESLQIAGFARPEMDRLTSEIRAVSCLFLPSADDLVVADLAHPADQDTSNLPLRAGDHIEFQPPLGSVLVAWANQHTVDTWLRRGDTFSENLDRSWSILRIIRRRRFAVELSPVPQPRMGEMTATAIGELHGSRRAERMAGGQRPVMTPDLMLGEVDTAAVYAPLAISAACFGPSGSPIAALSALTMAEEMTGPQLLALGERVERAAEDITRRLGGISPSRR